MRESPISPKFLRPDRETAEPSDPRADQPCFQKSSDNRGPELRVQFRFRNGQRQSLSYAYLIDLTIDPTNGIQLVFSTHQIRIRGQNLIPLYDLLSEQRVKWILEIDSLQAASVPQGATLVTGIQTQVVS